MSLRTGEIYLDWKVRHCLRLLAQASKANGAVGTTSDAIADKVLQEWVQQKYPQLWTWVQARQESEEQMVKELVNGKTAAANRGANTARPQAKRAAGSAEQGAAGDSGTGSGLD